MKKIFLLCVMFTTFCVGADFADNGKSGVQTKKQTNLERLQSQLAYKTNTQQCNFLIANFEKSQAVMDDLSEFQQSCVGLAVDVATMKPYYHTLSSKYDLPVGVLESISTADLVKKDPQDLLNDLAKKMVKYEREVKSSILLLPYDKIQEYKEKFVHYFEMFVAKKVLRDPLVLGRLMNMRDYLGLTFEEPYNNLSNPYFIRSH